MTETVATTDANKELRAIIESKGKLKPGDEARVRELIRTEMGAKVCEHFASMNGAIEAFAKAKVSGAAPDSRFPNLGLVITEMVKQEMEQQRAELGYESAPPLERLLINGIVLAWLRYTDLEQRYSAFLGHGDVNMHGAEWLDGLVSAAQRRYLRAVDMLARVRRIGVTVQLNIATDGGQQVNVTQAAP